MRVAAWQCQPGPLDVAGNLRRLDEICATAAARQVGDGLHGTAGRQVSILVGEAHDGVRVSNVDPLRMRAVGIKRDAEGLVQALGEDRRFFWISLRVDAAENLDFACGALGEEEVAVGREANEARIVETGGVELDFEALGRDGPGIVGAGNDGGAVIDGLVGRGIGQIGDGEMAADAWSFVRCVGKRGLAGENGRLRVLRYRDGAEGEQCAGKDEKAMNGREF